MPTEVTTETKLALSKTRQTNEVIGVSRTVARQNLSDNEQALPPVRETSQASSQQLEKATENLNKHVQSLKRDLHFSVDEDTGETIIRVIDSESQKTIRTIPSEEFLESSEHLNQGIGIIFNAHA